MPDNMIAVRKDSPLVIGKGDGENYISSDYSKIHVSCPVGSTLSIYNQSACDAAMRKKNHYLRYVTPATLIAWYSVLMVRLKSVQYA